MFFIFCAAFLACMPCIAGNRSENETDHDALAKAITENNFNVIIKQTVPKTSAEAVQHYDGGTFVIRVRGDHATAAFPKAAGRSEPGGTEGAIIFETTCELKSHKGKVRKYILKPVYGLFQYVYLQVTDNGTARVSVSGWSRDVWMGEAVVPYNTEE